MKGAGTIPTLLLLASCLGSATPTGDPASWLPRGVAAGPTSYQTGRVEQLANPLVFDEAVLREAEIEPASASLTVGAGDDGFTVFALRTPERDGRTLVGPMITASHLDPRRESTTRLNGHDVTVLELQPWAADTAYLVPIGDTLVVILSDASDTAGLFIEELPS